MSDLRPEDRIVSSKTDGLAELISGEVERWEDKRDREHRNRWMEYKRMWKGEWNAADKDRASERSKAIMPAIQQAVDSAVAEVEEGIFGKERWFDVASDDLVTEADESGPGRVLADRMMVDLSETKSAVSECAILAAVYGTGIGKVVISESKKGTGIDVSLVAIEPLEFVIEPGAKSIEEASGVAHVFWLPYNVVLERQRQGIYAKIDPEIGVEPGEERHVDERMVRIIEYHGLVPRSMLPDVSEDVKKLPFEEDAPIEAIVTIANSQVVLRAVETPFINRDRSFIAFQWDTQPNQFWGRGIVEKGYWAQKVLDSEVRARIDALGFSVHPMMAVNAAMVPRNADFSVRPGRNIFLNGSPSEALSPINFPPPDPQTYTQGQEMQRMIEMATGQLQAATPFASNGRNETASGMSMILGASIRRTRRTMANIERSFMKPFLRKAYSRFSQFDDRYTEIVGDFRMAGALGMMAREYEAMQLTQLLSAMPPGAPQFMLLRAVVDNMGITNREDMVRLLDLLTAQALEPQEEPRDLGGEARMLSAELRGREIEQQGQIEAARLNLERERLMLSARTGQQTHERDVMRLSVDAERAESEDMARTTKGILDLAKAEAEELGKQLGTYAKEVEDIKADQASTPTEQGGIDLSGIHAELAELKARMDGAPVPTDGVQRITSEGELSSDDVAPIQIERDEEGLIRSIAGRNVQRDDDGLIVGIQ